MPGRSSGADRPARSCIRSAGSTAGPLVPPTSFTCPARGRPGSATMVITTFCPIDKMPAVKLADIRVQLPVLQIGNFGDRHAGPHLIAHLKQRQDHAEERSAAGVLLASRHSRRAGPAASWPRYSRAPSSPAIPPCRVPPPEWRSPPRSSPCGWPDCAASCVRWSFAASSASVFSRASSAGSSGFLRTSSSAVCTSLSALRKRVAILFILRLVLRPGLGEMRFGLRQIGFRFFQFVRPAPWYRTATTTSPFFTCSPGVFSEVRCRSGPPVEGAVSTSGLPPRRSPRAVTSSVTSPRCTFAVGMTIRLRSVDVPIGAHAVPRRGAGNRTDQQRPDRDPPHSSVFTCLPRRLHLPSCGGSVSVTRCLPRSPPPPPHRDSSPARERWSECTGRWPSHRPPAFRRSRKAPSPEC